MPSKVFGQILRVLNVVVEVQRSIDEGMALRNRREPRPEYCFTIALAHVDTWNKTDRVHWTYHVRMRAKRCAFLGQIFVACVFTVRFHANLWLTINVYALRRPKFTRR